MFLGKRNYFSLTQGLFNAYPKRVWLGALPFLKGVKKSWQLGWGDVFRCCTCLGNGNNVGVLFVFVPPVSVGCSGSSRLAAK